MPVSKIIIQSSGLFLIWPHWSCWLYPALAVQPTLASLAICHGHPKMHQVNQLKTKHKESEAPDTSTGHYIFLDTSRVTSRYLEIQHHKMTPSNKSLVPCFVVLLFNFPSERVEAKVEPIVEPKLEDLDMEPESPSIS